MKILVVDDEESIRSTLEAFLDALGHTALLAAGGEEALDLLEHERPDIVLTDLRMPDMNGDGLARLAKQRWPELPVVLMTGDNLSPAEQRATGANAFLRKPFSGEELTQALRDALSTPAPAP